MDKLEKQLRTRTEEHLVARTGKAERKGKKYNLLKELVEKKRKESYKLFTDPKNQKREYGTLTAYCWKLWEDIN